MNKKEIKQSLLETKKDELLRFEITKEYLVSRIKQGDKGRKDSLNRVQEFIKEDKRLIGFLKK